MRVLVACEYSGVVRDAFRELGHNAWSCDLKPTLSDPECHMVGDVSRYLDTKWDLVIAHPPCTHLAVSGARWFKDKQEQQKEAIDFFMQFVDCADKVAIENPVSIMSRVWRKPDQIVHPWMFGEPFSKTTCLWLKNLPKLEPTNIVDKGEIVIHGGKRIPKWYSNRERPRDMTFTGMAKAMAAQWGGRCIDQN